MLHKNAGILPLNRILPWPMLILREIYVTPLFTPGRAA